MASEFAASQVFSQKKPHSGTRNLSMPLHSSDQLRDHDDAYSEGRSGRGKNNKVSQEKCYLFYNRKFSLSSSRMKNTDFWLVSFAAKTLLSDWLGSKLRLELEMEDEDDLLNPAGRRSPVDLACAQPAVLECNNFDGTSKDKNFTEIHVLCRLHPLTEMEKSPKCNPECKAITVTYTLSVKLFQSNLL